MQRSEQTPEQGAPRTIAIRTESLTRRFGDLTAVDDLTLEVPTEGIYGFLGPNGAGKTTTIRMLLGLIRPNHGRIEILGRDLAAERGEVLRRVGALVETPSLYDHLTGRENLEITRRLHGVERRHIDRVLDVVKLQDAAARRAGDYSLGMRQRLGLASALLAEPELLILDEPTNGLDPAGIREMRELIAELPRKHGVTVFLSSHMLNEIEQLADRLGIVRQGKLRFQGTPTELQSRRRGYLELGLERPAEARAILEAAGWKLLPTSNGRLHADLEGDFTEEAIHRKVGALNQELVTQGFQIHHLCRRQPSLESLFLEVTSAEGA